MCLEICIPMLIKKNTREYWVWGRRCPKTLLHTTKGVKKLLKSMTWLMGDMLHANIFVNSLQPWCLIASCVPAGLPVEHHQAAALATCAGWATRAARAPYSSTGRRGTIARLRSPPGGKPSRASCGKPLALWDTKIYQLAIYKTQGYTLRCGYFIKDTVWHF